MQKPQQFWAGTALALMACATSLHAAPPSIGGCQVFPANNYWNTPIDQLPKHPSSDTWVMNMGTTSTRMHADWGNKLDDGSGFNEIIGYGIPFVYGPSPTAATITFDYADESDPFQPPYIYRIPSNAPVEGGAGSGGDTHVISLDTTTCKLYELFFATQTSPTTWNAGSGAIFDLSSNALRPDGFTSADASGLALFPGLVKWEEVAAGEINHAIRFTATPIWGGLAGGGHKYIWPATHWSGSNTNSIYPPMGARFRLRADFPISGFNAQTQIILRAMKKYGLVLVDGGSNWYFSGMSNVNWPDIVISQLNSIRVYNTTTYPAPLNPYIFEAVDADLLRISTTSAQSIQVPDAPTGLAFTPGNGQATFNFVAPVNNGGAPITTTTYPGFATYRAYRVTCNPGNLTATADMLGPITVTGLTNGAAYTCSVAAANKTGVGASSATINVTVGLPAIGLSAATLNFSTTNLGASSGSQSLTVQNTGSSTLSLTAITVTGANAADFATSGTCTAMTQLAPMMTCSIGVTFSPMAIGTRSATVSIAHNAQGSPSNVSLSGNGRTVPGAPSIGTPVVGDQFVYVVFAPPVSDGGATIISYTATCGTGSASGASSPIQIAGLNNGQMYACTVTATNAAGTGPSSASANAIPDANPALQLIGVFSRKTHGAAGSFDLPLIACTGTGPYPVEPRMSGDAHRIVFRFNRAPNITFQAQASDENDLPLNGIDWNVPHQVAGSEIVISMGGLPERQRAKFVLTGPMGMPNYLCAMGFALGDTNGSQLVSAADIAAVKAQGSVNANTQNFRFDVNSSGTINSSDIAIVKSRSGTRLP